MKTCQHCGGDLLRHGVTRSEENLAIIGVRYICRDCRKSFTNRTEFHGRNGVLQINKEGRPTHNDWRFAA